MKDIDELIKERDLLPLGNIYKKIINGKEYFYHQYSLNGKKITNKVNSFEVEHVKEQIEKRKLLDKEINSYLKKGNRNITLSENAKSLTGYVMSKDKQVAEFSNGILVSMNEKLCPLVIKRTKRLERFLETRSIDAGRTNSRLLKKIMNIKETDKVLIALCSYGASISDDYWFKPKHSKLKFKDISFDNDMLFNTSLKGLISIYPNKIVLTPELTTNGSYEKGWKNIDGTWWLYKSETKNEIFSEMLYATLFEKLGLPTAHYEKNGDYIRTRNFSKDYNFEPMSAIADSNEDYDYIYGLLKSINKKIAQDYLKLCFFDVVLNNVDRHNENCGLLRDKKTGEIISLAPNYDDNLCLLSISENLNLSKDEGFLKQFAKLLKNNEEIRNALSNANIPKITNEILEECFKEIDMDVDKRKITDFILIRYETLINKINK